MIRTAATSLLATLLLIVASCNNNGKEVTSNQDTVAVADTPVGGAIPVIALADTSVIGCYQQLIGRDTALLQLDVKGENITGSLIYDFFEKDRNDGTLKADLDNGIVAGWYLFRSEGVMSVRQVAWQIKSGQLYPATGEMVQRNDTLLFKNIQEVNYDTKHPFVKIPCVM